MLFRLFMAMLLLSLACGSDSEPAPDTVDAGRPDAPTGGNTSTVNDGFVTAIEACDEGVFNNSYVTDCSNVAFSDLGTGTLTCTSTGTLLFENCSQPDLCLDQDIRDVGDGCDPCKIWGGSANVAVVGDCDACVADAFCADRWDVFAQGWACELVTGSRDPDCPVCGNGVRDSDGFTGAGEQCDGSDFGNYSCEALGYSGGSLACNANCSIDHSACVQ